MQKWEYCRVVGQQEVTIMTDISKGWSDNFRSQDDALAYLGSEGWELISYVVPSNTPTREDIYLFKRPLEAS